MKHLFIDWNRPNVPLIAERNHEKMDEIVSGIVTALTGKSVEVPSPSPTIKIMIVKKSLFFNQLVHYNKVV